MFAQAPFDVIPRTRQTIGARKTMITIFFVVPQLVLLDALPKGSKLNQQYFIDYVFPGLQMENRNLRRRMPLATFWVHMDTSMCHNGLKVVQNWTSITVHDCRTYPIRET
jgi:hypothetical protein